MDAKLYLKDHSIKSPKQNLPFSLSSQMTCSSNVFRCSSARIRDYEYLYAANTNVSNFVSVKLSGSGNYLLWKAQMISLLDSKNMCGIVDATFVAPTYSGTEIMRQYDSLVRGWIFGSVTEEVLVDVFSLGSAKAVWEKLKSIYDYTIGVKLVVHDSKKMKSSVLPVRFPDDLWDEIDKLEYCDTNHPYYYMPKLYCQRFVKAEQSMKNVAESLSITAALITAIVFAVGITVLDTVNNKETELLALEVKTPLIFFVISNAISLFASNMALLVFLSFMTSDFTEKDFLLSLPRRLFTGLCSFFLCIAALIVSLGATLFLVFCDKKPWKLVLICVLLFIVIAFFITVQSPLMVDLFTSTYIRIFGKQIKNHAPGDSKSSKNLREVECIKKKQQLATEPIDSDGYTVLQLAVETKTVLGSLLNHLLSASAQIQDIEYLYASNIYVSSFVPVSVPCSSDFLVWNAEMNYLLGSNNMCGIVDSTFVGPRYPGTDTMRQYDSLVRGWNFGCVTEDVHTEVFNLGSAKAVWEKLKSIHDPALCSQKVIYIKEKKWSIVPMKLRHNLCGEIHMLEPNKKTVKVILFRSPEDFQRRESCHYKVIQSPMIYYSSDTQNSENTTTEAGTNENDVGYNDTFNDDNGEGGAEMDVDELSFGERDDPEQTIYEPLDVAEDSGTKNEDTQNSQSKLRNKYKDSVTEDGYEAISVGAARELALILQGGLYFNVNNGRKNNGEIRVKHDKNSLKNVKLRLGAMVRDSSSEIKEAMTDEIKVNDHCNLPKLLRPLSPEDRLSKIKNIRTTRNFLNMLFSKPQELQEICRIKCKKWDTLSDYDNLMRSWTFYSVTGEILRPMLLNLIVEIPKLTKTASRKRNRRQEAKTADIEEHSIEIIVVQDVSSPENERKKKVHEVIINGDWSQVKSILIKDEGQATEAISTDGKIGTNDEQVLDQRNFDGNTSLHVAAIYGNNHAAELLVKKNSELLRHENHKDQEPLDIAYDHIEEIVNVDWSEVESILQKEQELDITGYKKCIGAIVGNKHTAELIIFADSLFPQPLMLPRSISHCRSGFRKQTIVEQIAGDQTVNLKPRRPEEEPSAEPLPRSTRFIIATGAAQGLAFLHTTEENVIYRDLKSANEFGNKISFPNNANSVEANLGIEYKNFSDDTRKRSVVRSTEAIQRRDNCGYEIIQSTILMVYEYMLNKTTKSGTKENDVEYYNAYNDDNGDNIEDINSDTHVILDDVWIVILDDVWKVIQFGFLKNIMNAFGNYMETEQTLFDTKPLQLLDDEKSIRDPITCLQKDARLAKTRTTKSTEVQDQSPPINEDTPEHVFKMEQNKKLHEVTVKGVWSEVESILKNDEDRTTEALHIADGIGRNDWVKNLFSYINDEQVVTKRVSDGSTPLHIAAMVGNKHAAELLVKKNLLNNN